MNSRFLHFLLALMMLLFVDATYAKGKITYTASDRVVSAGEIVAALNSSPRLSNFLSGNVEAIAALALGVESAGHTSVYNGTCCYGVLQMTGSNIRAYSQRMYGRKFGGETYRNLPLQQQIDMWVNLTVDGESSWGFQELMRRAARGEKFDGHEIDFSMGLACIQLGIGHCEDMVKAGKCNAFRDVNKTSICDMANGIRRRLGQQTYDSLSGEGTSTPTRPVATFQCRKNADGSCMSTAEAMRLAFREGSGIEMETLRQLIKALLASTTFLIMGSAMLTAWKSYTKGVIEQYHMLFYMKRAALVVLTVMVILHFT